MAHEHNAWKTIAIIFIILFILETVFIIWFVSAGIKMEANDAECSINICGEIEGATYYYDTYTQICYCYKNGEVVKQKFIKS